MRFVKFLTLMFVCLLAFGYTTRAADDAGTHEVYHVTFAAPIRVGGNLLPAGEYVVHHTMEANDHVMVFQSVNHKHPDVKAKCQLVQLGNKADQTRTVFELNAAKERVLQELVFGGDTAKHVF